VGVPAHDIGQLFSFDVPVEIRRLCENDILHKYHRALIKGGVKNYSFDVFFRDYVFGMYVLII
jgi:hypothetical protein